MPTNPWVRFPSTWRMPGSMRSSPAASIGRSAGDPRRAAGLVMLPMPTRGGGAGLGAVGGIIAKGRPGHARFSPLLYNGQDALDQAPAGPAARPAQGGQPAPHPAAGLSDRAA